MYKKPLIVFEGIEASGKSYHLASVARYLKQRKINFIKIREPGGSLNSEKIRRLMLNNRSSFNKVTDLLLFLSSRSENISLIKKNYKKKIILIDRFTDSTIAYQHYGMGVNLKLINMLNNYLLKNIKINFTFLNTVNSKNLFLRLKKRKSLNRYDKFNSAFYDKVQKGFIKLANMKKRSYMIINSNLEIEKNRKLILNKVIKLI